MSRRIFRSPRARAPVFYHYSAQERVVGKLAAHLARIICGKHKPIYNPAVDCGDNVVVTNVERVVFTGQKRFQKAYHWHTGFVGNLQVRPVSKVLEETPERVLWKAVYGMLPKNRLRRLRMKRLRLYRGDEHPHAEQVVEPPPHLQFTSKYKDMTPETAADVADVPGYWIELREGADGEMELVTREQRPNGAKIPKANQGQGLFKRGENQDYAVDIKPMEEIPKLASLAKLTNRKEADEFDDDAGAGAGKAK